MAQNFKLKVLTLITKLSDRDTYASAAAELDSIASALDNTTLSTFLSCILSTDSADKTLVRKRCLHLLSTLSLTYTNALSSYLPKILSYLVRRIRDSDSSIRAQCITTVSSLASSVTKAPFSAAFLKPLSESVFTEHEPNAQIGSAMCLAAAIDATPDPDPGRLGRALLPRLERLLKSEAYRAKSSALVVMASVIGVGGMSGYSGMGGLVKCLVGFLSSEDWAARKAAAEALGKLAVTERDAMAEFKNGSLKVFENRKFDKVKAVREVMSQMIEVWKQVPDFSEEVSPPPRSTASSRDDASDGRYPSGCKNSCAAVLPSKKSILASKSIPPNCSSATDARKRGVLKSTEKKASPATFGKIDSKKTVDWKVKTSCNSVARSDDSGLRERNENAPERRFMKPDIKRSLFSKSSDGKMLKLGGPKSGSGLVPSHEENVEFSIILKDGAENHDSNHKESEDLSSIRRQLVQIERQQSNLLDLLQNFIGSSQNGMRSLETRVHGLELALDEISYDLAVSNGRMTNTGSHRLSCCLLPGADFFSSKFWRKTDGRFSALKFSSSSGTSSLAALRQRADKNGSSNAETFNFENSRLRLQGRGGFVVNPLAEIRGDSRGILEVSQH